MFSQLISDKRCLPLALALALAPSYGWFRGGGDGSSYMRWMEDEEDGGGLERGLDLLFAGQWGGGGCWQPTERTPSLLVSSSAPTFFPPRPHLGFGPIRSNKQNICFCFDLLHGLILFCAPSLKGKFLHPSMLSEVKAQFGEIERGSKVRSLTDHLQDSMRGKNILKFFLQKIVLVFFVVGRNWPPACANWELCVVGEVGGRIILIMQILQTWAIFPNTGVKNLNSFKGLKLKEYIVLCRGACYPPLNQDTESLKPIGQSNPLTYLFSIRNFPLVVCFVTNDRYLEQQNENSNSFVGCCKILPTVFNTVQSF